MYVLSLFEWLDRFTIPVGLPSYKTINMCQYYVNFVRNAQNLIYRLKYRVIVLNISSTSLVINWQELSSFFTYFLRYLLYRRGNEIRIAEINEKS